MSEPSVSQYGTSERAVHLEKRRDMTNDTVEHRQMRQKVGINNLQSK